MKKVIFSASALFILITTGLAQVSFGVKAGVNSSTQKYKSIDGTTPPVTSKTGLAAGGFAEISVSDNFAVQPELLYSQMGAKFTPAGTTVTAYLDYIAIPVLAKFKASGFGLYAGPQLGILANSKYKSGGTSISGKDDYKSIDFSGVVGAEYTFVPGVVISVRYLLPLSNIVKSGGNSNFASGDKVTNSAFNFTIGYKFGGSDNN